MPLYNEEKYAKLYKKTGDKQYRDKAVEEMRDLVHSTISKFNQAKSIETTTIFNKGLGIAYQAVDSWDPTKGAKLTTHVVNLLKPLLRTVYQSNIMHTPEHRIKNWSVLQASLVDYEIEYGTVYYDPIIIARMSGLPLSQVKEFLKENRKVYNTSDVSTTNISWPKQDYKMSLDLVSYEFKEDKQTEKIWGLMKKDIEKGKKPSASAMAKKLKIPYTDVNRIYKEIVEKVQHIVSGSKAG